MLCSLRESEGRNIGVRMLYLKAEPHFISEVKPSAFVILCANFVVTRRRD